MGSRSKGPYSPIRRGRTTYRYSYEAKHDHDGEGKAARRIRRARRGTYTDLILARAATRIARGSK
jgi:hypothetical protein